MKKALLFLPFLSSSLFCQITTPSSVETRLGKLEFPLGVPTTKTADTLYNHVDYLHGINSFLTGFSGASLWAMRQAFLKAGVVDNTVLLFSKQMDGKSLFLTPNADTINFFSFIDLSNGPIVVEIPANTKALVNDLWGRFVIDGKGGEKFLLVPPGYSLPMAVQAKTTRLYFLGQTFDNASSIKENFRIYPYNQARETHFVEGSTLQLNTIPPNDFSFYEMMNELVQDQPVEALDPEIAGNLAAIGIVKGKKFEPDASLKETLNAAVVHGNGVSRVLVFRPRFSEGFNYYDASSHWLHEKSPHIEEGASMLNARTAYFYIATGLTPSQDRDPECLIAFLDSQNEPLDGAKSYKLTLPSAIPASRFWSVTLYDNQTRSLLKSPAHRASNSSTTLYFGPEKPQQSEEENWIQTVPEHGYFVILRLYGPLPTFFDKTWKPSDIDRGN